MRGVARTLLAMGLALSTGGYFTAQERVTVTDGSRVIKASTFAPTVGAALSRLGVRLLAGDRVIPSRSAALSERIEVRRARPVPLLLNGQPSTPSLTGRSVGELLGELSVDPAGAWVFPSITDPVPDGETTVVAQPVSVTVAHDGRSEQVTTSALTVGGVLRQMGLSLGPSDRVLPSLFGYPSAGSTISIIRVNTVIETSYVKIPFKRTAVPTDTLEFGLRKVGTPGVQGLRAQVYETTYNNGRAVSRHLMLSRVAQQPRDETTLVGTHRPSFVSHGGSQTGLATWYSFPGLGAAHRTLPMGTVVRVTNLANGRWVDVVIRDRGPWGDGRVIDLSDTAFRELAPTGQGVLNVKLSW